MKCLMMIFICLITFISMGEMPIGIPTPTFGITNVVPNMPTPWDGNSNGFFYINWGVGSDTQSFGYPSAPRKTIPRNITNAVVLIVGGDYGRLHTSPNNITCWGTEQSPCWFVTSNSSPAIITNAWEIGGSYFIVDSLNFEGHFDSPVIQCGSPSQFGTIRYSNLKGSTNQFTTSVIGLASYTTNTIGNYLILSNTITDGGNPGDVGDTDVHGIGVANQVTNLWIIGNTMAYNQGDGMQINAGAGNASNTHHIYVGWNHAISNRQAGLWSKQATDVIMSQNICEGARPAVSAPGAGMGCQYGPSWIWFIGNTITNCEAGIEQASTSDLGPGDNIFIIDNLIVNCNFSTNAFSPTYDPNNSFETAGIMLWSGYTNRYIINNTINNCSAGVHVSASDGQVILENNIIGMTTQPTAHQLLITSGTVATSSKAERNNGWSIPFRINWAGSVYTDLSTFQTVQNRGTNDITANEWLWSDDYHLSINSSAINRGRISETYAIFQSRYGISITTDLSGVTRPQGTTWDIGAYEYNGHLRRNSLMRIPIQGL